MRKQKYYLYLTAEERRHIFKALLAFRNKLIAQGRYTDANTAAGVKILAANLLRKFLQKML